MTALHDGPATAPTSAAGDPDGYVGPAWLRPLDVAALRLTRTVGHTPAAEHVARRFTRLGEHGACWIALGVAGSLLDLDHARRPRWRRAAATVAGTYAVNHAIKVAVGRPRPRLPGLGQLTAPPTQLSFPSAHASTSAAAVQAFAGLAPSAPVRAAAIAMTVSRLYLGVHYPSDIVAGLVLGTTVGRIARAAA